MADIGKTKLGADIGFGNTPGSPPIVDPTENVIALTKAAVLRIDDLAALNASLTNEKVLRIQEGLDHLEKIVLLRADHNREIRHMESDRVDKIRSVDVANAAATATQLLSAVTTLATTAQATAETLRNQVAATAAAVASQTERVVNPILERVALLEKSSYTGAGKAGVSDPQIAELSSAVNKLLAAGSMSSGKEQGFSASWAILLGTVALIGSLITIGSLFYAMTQRQVTPAPVYEAAPAAGRK